MDKDLKTTFSCSYNFLGADICSDLHKCSAWGCIHRNHTISFLEVNVFPFFGGKILQHFRFWNWSFASKKQIWGVLFHFFNFCFCNCYLPNGLGQLEGSFKPLSFSLTNDALLQWRVCVWIILFHCFGKRRRRSKFCVLLHELQLGLEWVFQDSVVALA